MISYLGIRNRSRPNTAIAYLSLALIVSLCLVFSACERAQQTMAPAATEATAPAAISIGLIHTTPSPGTTLNGAQVAVDEINAAGGVNGAAINLIAKDDKNVTADSVTAAEALIKEGVLGIIGPDWSPHAFEVAKKAQAAGVPMVTTYPTNPAVPDAGDFVFMGAFTDDYQGDVAAKFAVESLKAKTAAILTEKGRAYSEGLSKFFQERFTALGGSTQQEFYAAKDTDFKTQLTKIATVSPDVIFVAGFVPEVPHVVKQAREMGIKSTFLGGDGWDNPELITIGGTALEGSFFVNHFSAESVKFLNDNARQFSTAYQAKFNKLPDGPSALGYDAVYILVQAMQRAKNLTSTAIRDEIAATKDYSGAAILSHYNEKRQPIKSGVVSVITNGKIQAHQLVKP